MRRLERALLWRRLDEPSLEHFRLWRQPDGAMLEGAVVLALEGRPATVRYEIVCDARWVTRSVVVRLSQGDETRTLQLAVDSERRWRSGGAELDALRGCLDVDLSVTPATNLLPIRRLNLAIGQLEPVTAAWVRFPSLAVELLPQTYERTVERRYRYASNDGEFQVDLDVDDLGLPLRYADYWEAVAAE